MTGDHYTGQWTYTSKQAAEWGLPSKAAGILSISSVRVSTLHEIQSLTTPIRTFKRRWYNGVWVGAWEPQHQQAEKPESPGPKISEPEPEFLGDLPDYDALTTRGIINSLIPDFIDPTATFETLHSALVAKLQSRLGPVNLNGSAGIALTFDHGTTVFFERIWPELKAREIPATLALCPEIHLDGRGDRRNRASNDTIIRAVHDGLEIAAHSSDHGGAHGYFDIHRQIVTSKQLLEDKLNAKVDSWIQHGYPLSKGNFDGFGVGRTLASYADTAAGRLLQQTYPVITGYVGVDYIYPPAATPVVGMKRSICERRGSIDTAKDYIELTIAMGGKHVNFIHPSALVGNSTYHSVDDYIEFLDWLVLHREDGEIKLLTLPQVAIAV